jgi:pyridoxamine 5'-phosphate oxidase
MDFTFAAVLADATMRLGEAVKSARHPMHTPVIGTSDGDLRIMVLREATPDLSRLRFHTDRRSPKVAMIGDDAAVSVLAYDPAARLQLRMQGRGRIEHTGPIADAAWDAAQLTSKRCYLAQTGPGGTLDAPGAALPDFLLDRSPSTAEAEAGRENFAVLLVEVRSLDWLQLTHHGGVRARFERQSAYTDWQPEWLAP